MLLAICSALTLASLGPGPWASPAFRPAPVQGDDFDLEKAFEGWLERCVWIKREVQSRLLEPSESVVREHADLLKMDDTGAASLVDRRHEDTTIGRSILYRGGGAYYSFVTRSHSYDSQPDIQLSGGRLSSGFAGRDFGTIYPLGTLGIGEIDGAGEQIPAGIPEASAKAWPVLWAPIDPQKAANRDHQRDPFWQREASSVAVGESYLLRAWCGRGHDVLVALHIAEKTEYGLTLVWRKLRSFPMENGSDSKTNELHSGVRDFPGSTEAGMDLESMSLDSLFEQLEIEIDEARGELLSVPRSKQDQYLKVIGPVENFAQRSGFFRLMERGKADGILGQNVGCYYSFARQSHGWDARPEIGLENGGLGGGQQNLYALDLGALPFAAIAKAVRGECPVPDDERLAKGWAALHGMKMVRNDRNDLVPDGEWPKALVAGGVNLPRGRDPLAVHGHTYLLRTSGAQGDLLITVTVLEKDALGASLAYRILESYPLPAKK